MNKADLISFLNRFKKLIIVTIVGLGGLFLTLEGLNLIQLSQVLILYTGVTYIVLAILLHFFL